MTNLLINRFRSLGRSTAGVSLTELIIATVVLAVGIVGLMATFRFIAINIQKSKSKALANNLAMEQVEIMKSKSYYSLLVTTSTTNDVRFSPALAYDDSAYPPETLEEGGILFTRATRVDSVFQNGSALTVVPWTSDDTGLKKITVYVMWQDNGEWRYYSHQNLLSNLSTGVLDGRISGTVTKAGLGTPISGAVVTVVENNNYNAITSNAGAYSFAVTPGSYTVTCSSRPYFPGFTTTPLSVDSGANVIAPFSLTAMASSSVTTDVYVRDHVVISQIVASTGAAGEFEYLELYNPTNQSISMGLGAPSAGASYWANRASYLFYYKNSGGWRFSHLTYIHPSIPPHGFYLIANALTVSAAGVTRTADATYTDGYSWEDGSPTSFLTPNHMFELNEAAGLYLARKIGVGWYVEDSLVWCKGGVSAPPGSVETACRASALGLQPDEQFVRTSATGTVLSGWGPAYDSQDNSKDFVDNPTVTVPPRNHTDIEVPLTGTPAIGAWVALSDPLSEGSACVNTTLPSGHSVCRYTTSAATGTWTALGFVPGAFASGNYFDQVDGITVGASAVSFPNATTTPPWALSPRNYTILESTTANAYVAGTVYGVGGAPLSGITIVGSGGNSYMTGASGRYFVYALAGASVITANPGNTVGSYSMETLNLATVPGALYDPQNFVLSQAGGVRGFFRTTSNQPLPGRVAVALLGASEEAQASSDNTGYFYLKNLSTGTYTIQPALDPIETVSPSSATVTVTTPGTSVFVATFTVSSGFATIRGQARVGAIPVNTGVVVLASTSTLAGGAATPPPTVTGTSGCAPCYYETSSDPNGLFTLTVRSNALDYKLYGYYTTFSGSTPTTTRVGPFSVSVTAPSSTATQDLVW